MLQHSDGSLGLYADLSDKEWVKLDSLTIELSIFPHHAVKCAGLANLTSAMMYTVITGRNIHVHAV